MRSVFTMISAAVVLAAACGGWPDLAVSEQPESAPMLLELNPPLLLQPIQNEPDDEAATGGASAPVKDKTPAEPPELTRPRTDSTPDDAVTPPQDNTDKSAEQNADSQQSSSQPPVEPADEPPPPLPELSDQMKALRATVRRTIAGYFVQPINTRDNTPAHVLDVCMAFGCDAQIRRDSSAGQKVNAFTCLCWNYPCAGQGLLRLHEGQVVASVGYGLQKYPAEFLAAMALSRVPIEYPLHVGDEVRAVSDLVEYEKRSCRAGEETSFRLIGLARYVPTDAMWQNDRGETWSISRLLKEELNRPTKAAPAGGTFRLLALSYAVDRRMKRDEPIDGQFARARDYLAEFTDYALDLQNDDGSWPPAFFADRGRGGSSVDQLGSTGRVLCWLALALPDERLQDPRIVRGMSFLTGALDMRRYRTYVHASSSREIAARFAAVHALVIYNDRLFVPYDVAEKAKQQEKETKQEPVAAKPPKRS